MRSKLCILTFVLMTAAAVIPESAAQGRPRNFRWASDGYHLISGGKWLDPATGKETPPKPRVQKKPSFDTAGQFNAALKKANGGRRIQSSAFKASRIRSTIPRTPGGSPGMHKTPDGRSAVVIHNGSLWAWSAGKGARRLKDGLAAVRRFEMAPDGTAVSYLQNNNLYITRTDKGKSHPLSDDANENLFYGELDWVYQEEVYGRAIFKGTWWSPDSAHLAYLRIEEDGVNTFTVVDHIPDKLGLENIKYPKAGTTNPRATLHVGRARDGRRVTVDLSKYRDEDEILIVRVGWTPEGDNLFYKVQNREQTWLDLNLADPRTGKSRTIIHEEAPRSWVNVLSMPRWLKDGSFLWESERNGFKHLYHYDRRGKLLDTTTSGEWEVRSIIQLDEKNGHVTFYASKDSAVGQNAYRVNIDGSDFTRLTEGRGTHRISINGDATMYIDACSSLESPAESWVKSFDGKISRELSRTPMPEGANVARLQQIQARDGETLDVTVLKPVGFDPTKKYPVWIETYSGPDAPTVRDRWRNPGGWHSSNGIILLQVNVRSASGRGMKYTSQCYRQFGVQELRDLEDAVTWLTKNNTWADASRVGMSGWSYGGFMTAYAMTHSKMFKCGVAGAGVYAWELYDTIYTERYMAKPQNNPDGYKVSSVVEAAGNLHGNLLIVHGTMDDNVHMQNAIQFIHALQKANKQNFTFMIYPKSRHGVGSGHLRTLRENFILKNL